MNGTTPIYSNGLGSERVKQAEIATLEAKINVLQNRKRQFANDLRSALDKAQEEKDQAIEYNKITLASLQALNENGSPKLVSYQKQLIDIASHPKRVISNKRQLQLLSRDIEQALTSADILEVKKRLKQLNLLTKCLKATTKIVAYCRIINSKVSQAIQEDSVDVDTQITQLKGQIATLKGYNLQHEMTAESPVNGVRLNL